MRFDAGRARRKAKRAAKRARSEAQQEAQAYLAEHEPIASWGDRIHLCEDRLVRLGPRFGRSEDRSEIVPLDRVRAELGPPGQASPRPGGSPGTRQGIRQRLESREVWLTISGPGFRWQDPVPPKVAEPARDFAIAVNNHVAARSTGTRHRRRRKRKH